MCVFVCCCVCVRVRSVRACLDMCAIIPGTATKEEGNSHTKRVQKHDWDSF